MAILKNKSKMEIEHFQLEQCDSPNPNFYWKKIKFSPEENSIILGLYKFLYTMPHIKSKIKSHGRKQNKMTKNQEK